MKQIKQLEVNDVVTWTLYSNGQATDVGVVKSVTTKTATIDLHFGGKVKVHRTFGYQWGSGNAWTKIHAYSSEQSYSALLKEIEVQQKEQQKKEQTKKERVIERTQEIWDEYHELWENAPQAFLNGIEIRYIKLPKGLFLIKIDKNDHTITYSGTGFKVDEAEYVSNISFNHSTFDKNEKESDKEFLYILISRYYL